MTKTRDDLWKELQQVKSDCLTLALRLHGEDESSFAPETLEVMKRWRPKIEEVLTFPFKDQE